MPAEISIVMQYRQSSDKCWTTRRLTPPEYFDLDASEIADLDSVPHHNHACDYLPIPLNELAETKIILTEGTAKKRSIFETFWGDGRHRLIERIDEGPEPYRELILSTEVQSDPCRYEILRMVDQASRMNVTSHVIIETLPDGTEREVFFFLNTEHK